MTREWLGIESRPPESESIDRGSSWRVTRIAVNRLWRTLVTVDRRMGHTTRHGDGDDDDERYVVAEFRGWLLEVYADDQTSR